MFGSFFYPKSWVLGSSQRILSSILTKKTFLRSFSVEISTSLVPSGSLKQHDRSFTVTYLIDSCGLSQEAANSASKYVHFETSKKPNSVLNLLETYGFTQTHISNLVRKTPQLLLAHPEKTLKPKLEFFCSVGISPSDLHTLLCSNPCVLRCSLDNRIVPTFEFLKSIVGTDKDVIAVLKRYSWILHRDPRPMMLPKISALQDHGVPVSFIVQLVKQNPRILAHKTDRLIAVINVVKEMGFDPLRHSFIEAVRVLLGMSKSKWKRKWEIYRKWGCSDDDIISAFKKGPLFMAISEVKMEKLMDFLVNKMGLDSSDVARFPAIMTRSLTKRIVPRCLVVQRLLSKGLIKKNPSLNNVAVLGEKRFLNMYVAKYCAEVPDLLSFYQRKIDGLGFDIQSIGPSYGK